MPRHSNPGRLPTYRRHKASGQAVVVLNGQWNYLGPYGSAASRQAYNRLTAEWLRTGRGPLPIPSVTAPDAPTLSVLFARYLDHARGYYVKHGEHTKTFLRVRLLIRTLRPTWGTVPVAEFTPSKFKAIRDGWVAEGLRRRTVNLYASSLRAMFKFGVAEGLVPVTVWQALTAVDGLRAGRSPAVESEPVRPVSDDLVDRTLPHLPRHVAAMVLVQRLTGMRSQEVCAMNGAAIDTSGEVWLYRPPRHKSEHIKGSDRVIAIGPKAQGILRPFLRHDLSAALFQPCEAEAERRAAAAASRTTPLSCGNRPGSNRVRRPRRVPGPQYTTGSYGRCIARACELHDLPRWSPHQLRHARATELRRSLGLDAAGAVLGHKGLDVTLIYAERAQAVAVDAARRTG